MHSHRHIHERQETCVLYVPRISIRMHELLLLRGRGVLLDLTVIPDGGTYGCKAG